MTLHGEQKAEQLDLAIHQDNLSDWNAWACQNLSDGEITKIARSLKIKEIGLRSWPFRKPMIEDAFIDAWNERNPGIDCPELPSPENLLELGWSDFSETVNAIGFVFPKLVSFRHCRFQKEAHFDSAYFCQEAQFHSTSFKRSASFGGTHFVGEATFSPVSFAGSSSFMHASFNTQSTFSNTQFHEAWFSYAKFSGPARFAEAQFRGEARFNSTHLEKNSDFAKVKFGELALFLDATLMGEADFGASVFAGEVDFRESTFTQKVSFNDATFVGNTKFDNSEFSGSVYFKSAKLQDFTSFAEAKIGKGGNEDNPTNVKFNECQFEKPFSFREVKFFGSYPDFSGAVLHERATFSAHPDYWPKNVVANLVQARASCATIRFAIAKQGLPEDEHFFYRQEMELAGKIAAAKGKTKSGQLPYLLFGRSSDFGHSIAKPTYALLIIWALPFAAYWGFFEHHEYAGANMGTAIALSLNNVVPVFGFGQYFAEDFIRDLPTCLKVFGGIARVLGFIFLFLWALAIRTRFRLR